MRLSVKTLTGVQFFVEVDEQDTVAQVKAKIESEQGHPAAAQKLIHAGKVLKDDQSLQSAAIKPNDFVVCMVSKAKAPPKPAEAPRAAAPAPSAPAAPAPAPAQTTPTPPVPPSQTTAPQSPRRTAPQPAAPIPPSQPAAGALQPSADLVRQLSEMGFPEDQVRAALQAAFNNPDRAVEYLMNGIPEVPAQPAAPPSGSQAHPPASLNDLRNQPEFNQLRQVIQANPSALPMVLQQIGQSNPALLQLIHQNQEEFVRMLNEPITAPTQPAAPPAAPPAMPSVGADPGAAGAGVDVQQVLNMLRSLSPEQQAQVAQSFGMTPQSLNDITQMLATMPPERVQQIFGSMAGLGGMGGGPTPVTIQLTQEESEAVNRLAELGFDRSEALQAYLACDKNEALAANFLMDSMDWDGQEGAGGDEDMYG